MHLSRQCARMAEIEIEVAEETNPGEPAGRDPGNSKSAEFSLPAGREGGAVEKICGTVCRGKISASLQLRYLLILRVCMQKFAKTARLCVHSSAIHSVGGAPLPIF